MKRAILIGAGTVAGAAAVLSYQPGALFSGTAGTAAAAEPTSTSQTYTGDAVETGFGAVQVEVTVDGSTVTDVTAIAVPQNDPKSSQISAYAIPELEQQAVTAQSATIDGVSGASYTSAGFAQSLQSALPQAGLA
jgi:uncharacterized protein with FMN-binding domain